jgi:isoleucyl-tRNA synthetase
MELKKACHHAVSAGVMKINPLANFRENDMSSENYDQIDLHKHHVDKIILASENGEPMKRELDLIDVWFDSGAMPYAQWHYPFENKELIDNNEAFPADFIAEGVDQTRGWFYTLHAISTLVFGSVAYKNVLSNGLVLDKNGLKMSKRLGNGIDPFETLEKYGPDATRWYMITNAQPWDNLKFDAEGIVEVQRKFFGTLYNTYSFFALYANIDGFTFDGPTIPVADRPEIDRWIISKLNSLIQDVNEAYDAYEPTKAGRLVQDFVTDQLSNWYVRLCRRRFWKNDDATDKRSAYQTLYTCLEQVAIISSPIAPFFMDQLFMDLNRITSKSPFNSVHHCSFPTLKQNELDRALESRMTIAQRLSSLALGLRKKEKIRVRQPLAQLLVPALSVEFSESVREIQDLILSEVNIKSLRLIEDDGTMLVKNIKPNFKSIGKKYGAQMKGISSLVAGFDQEIIRQIEQEGNWVCRVDGVDVALELADFEISAKDIPGWLVANDGELTVALDITITEELRAEGIAREFVNRIQNIRKEKQFDVTDRIRINYSSSLAIERAIEANQSYICAEVLADELVLTKQFTSQILIDIDESGDTKVDLQLVTN